MSQDSLSQGGAVLDAARLAVADSAVLCRRAKDQRRTRDLELSRLRESREKLHAHRAHPSGGPADRSAIVQLREKISNLEIALASSRRIGMALGILMSKYRISDEDALDLMREASQTWHRKVRELADDVVFSGDLITPPGA